MKKSVTIAFRIWGVSCLLIAASFAIANTFSGNFNDLPFSFIVLAVAAVGGIPALLLVMIVLPFIKRFGRQVQTMLWQLTGLLLLIALLYGAVGGLIVFLFDGNDIESIIEIATIIVAAIFVVSLIASAINYTALTAYLQFNTHQPIDTSSDLFQHQQIQNKMNTEQNPGWEPTYQTPDSMQKSTYNKNLIKAAITAGLILAMLIPAQFVSSLVTERAKRQEEVTTEVSSKWAAAQTISTPYLCIPYTEVITNDTGKVITRRNMLFETASTLDVKANMQPEMRKRSIYNVLLYKSDIAINGRITPKPGKDIKPENLFLNEARLCIGVSDFKGIEEKVIVNFNDSSYEMEPGLPDYAIDKQGLSAPVNITIDALKKELSFSMHMKIKGSEQLHFLPLSDNSNFEISSAWPSPSFDGSTLPKERAVSDSGFTANWSFNKANMPVLAQLFNTNADKESMSFGVTMIQPADQYAKTNRSIKYAILFVGLTFAMFFIIELMQKKNVHPVQYLLVGLALIIFYTLLLSISEYTGFNKAYGIAAAATVILIGSYASSSFQSYKTGAILTLFVSMLYGFIYLLIQLEDTALLAGSIGLFVILALAMYFSRRINWYGNTSTQVALGT